jgi:predicted flap endonuclease-1-like 5' DNA nuclease
MERERGEYAAKLQAGDRELDKLRKRLAHLQPRSRGARSRTKSGGASANRPPTPTPRDNLKRIRGIGPALERKLNALGCHTFADIVAWEPAEIERIAQVVRASPKRIRSEWVKQARQYARRDGQTV